MKVQVFVGATFAAFTSFDVIEHTSKVHYLAAKLEVRALYYKAL
jgi:hypothetical protein